MNASASPLRRTASFLMRASKKALPPARGDWAEAMHAEFLHIHTDRQALHWAVGCLLVSIKERMSIMITGNLKISRWLLTPEMLLCFLPLTLLWLDGIDGRSGLLRLGRAQIDKYFFATPSGTWLWIALASGIVLATVGPMALIAAFRWIVWRRSVENRALRTALIAAPILVGLMSLIARAASDGASGFDLAAADAFDFWSGVFLLSVLPALGAAHLLRLSPPVAA